MRPDFKAFLDAEFAEVPAMVKAWAGQSVYREILMGIAELHWVIDQDDIIKEEMMEHPVKGAKLDDYRPHLIDIAGMGRVLATMRFSAMGFDQPFIDIAYKTFPYDSPDVLRRLAQGVAPHFAVFEPKWIHVNVWGAALNLADDIIGENRLMVAPIGEIRKREKPPHSDEVKLRRVRDLSGYEFYSAAYDAFHADSPQLQQVVPKDTPQLQQIFIHRGLVYNVFIDKQWAGLISLIEATEMGISGLEIADVILSKDIRGKGYAAAIQYNLIKKLKFAEDTLIIGTINPRNLPSLKTAQRVGRVDVGGGYYIAIS